MSNSYRDLVVWQAAIELVTRIYRTTDSFPKQETYGLTAQIRRAAVSVPSNIAEGQGRNSAREFLQFLGHARGSLVEVETQLFIACNLAYITREQRSALLEESDRVSRLLNGLMLSLKKRQAELEKPETKNEKLYRKGAVANG
ncbi:MAG TPA: four helix bundle protein [Terriglobales bacterium]|nr:four helix bundle protein [Terriglobales bacterium]